MESAVVVRCLSVLNVNFCKKSPKWAQMTFDRYLSNPDIGRTFWDGLTHSNGEPSLFVDRQMALLCNSDIHSTGSSIVYMLIFDCLGN